MVCCLDEVSSSPVENTASDDGAEKTGGTKSSRAEVVSVDLGSEDDFGAGSESTECNDLDGKGVTGTVDTSDRSADVDVIDADARPQLSTSSTSSLPAISKGPDNNDSDLWETECPSSVKSRRRCCSSADSELQLSPKRIKFLREDNVSGSTSDENCDDALHAKISL